MDERQEDALYDFQIEALRRAFSEAGIESVNLVRESFKTLVADAAREGLIDADDDAVKLTMLTFDTRSSGEAMTMATKPGRRKQLASLARSITGVSIAHDQGREDWALFAAFSSYWLQSLSAELFGALGQRHQSTRPAAAARRVAAVTKRAQAFAAYDEMKRKNPHLSKDDVARKLVERGIYASFSRARDVLRERRTERDDDTPECDDDSPRRDDDML